MRDPKLSPVVQIFCKIFHEFNIRSTHVLFTRVDSKTKKKQIIIHLIDWSVLEFFKSNILIRNFSERWCSNALMINVRLYQKLNRYNRIRRNKIARILCEIILYEFNFRSTHVNGLFLLKRYCGIWIFTCFQLFFKLPDGFS